MLCSDLKDGMLVKITNPDQRGWFNLMSHARLAKRFENIPPRFVIGPDVISYLMRIDGVNTVVKPDEIFVYLGKKKLLNVRKGGFKTVRLVLAKGKVGYIEGRDIRKLEPA
tara:strand:+ start:457 stop:789 length:333 start_codon:yes stop_codon:yes gene_type:complete